MNFKIDESARKLRGGYYTPSPIAEFLSRWILSNSPHSVLEPACGDGVFVGAFCKLSTHRMTFTGVEQLAEEAAKARERGRGSKTCIVNIDNCDFLEWALERLQTHKTFDAVVGNPPYIRYQYLEKRDQELSESIFASCHLPFTKRTNTWVPFVLASIALLSPGGRLAMVVPAELLHILHAESLRKYLLSSCQRILVIDPHELLFEDALQGTILLMVEKKTGSKRSSPRIAIVAEPNNDFLDSDPNQIFAKAPYVSGKTLEGKWMKLLLDPSELATLNRVCRLPLIKRFSDVASVDVGIVTGANKFFLVDDATVEKYDLQKYVHPMFGRSQDCRGLIYSRKLHKSNGKLGLPTNFVEFDDTPFKELPQGAQSYIRLGETLGLPQRYKCRIRTPWYCVPSVYKTHLGMLKRSHNFPRLILNKARVYSTDTAYRIKASLKPDEFVYSFVNSLTALSAELEGRHYGGGVLELVPSEIEKLLVPVAPIPNADLGSLDAEISSGRDFDATLTQQDAIVLAAAGLSEQERASVHKAYLQLRSRRQRLHGEKADKEDDIEQSGRKA